MNVYQLSPSVMAAADASRLPNESDLAPDEVYIQPARATGPGAIEAEVEPTRTELTPAQQLLGAVIAQAAADCRTALKRKAEGKFTAKDMPLAASACRFFLSESGRSMIHACGMGHEGVRAGTALAETAMRRLGLSADALLCDSEESWMKVVTKDNLAHAAAMNRPRVPTQPGLAFRLVA